MKLSHEVVNKLFMECLTDNTRGSVLTEMILATVWLDVRGHEVEVKSLLDELSPDFHTEGASFLNACYDKDGTLWTGSHRTMDELFGLGRAAGFVDYCLGREFWSMLPGGVPYLLIHDKPRLPPIASVRSQHV